MKTVLVTGSTGFLGSNLVKALSAKKIYNVIGAVEDPSGKTDRYECNEFLHTVSNEKLLNGEVQGVDIVVNCAFARSNDPQLLSDALNFTSMLAIAYKKMGIKSLINISSQGVYKRLPSGELQTEDSVIDPIDIYSLAKYATEKIFIASACADHVTNVRLASLNMKQRFLYAFVKKVFNGEKIVLTAPDRNAALLDIKDAVDGIIALIDLSDSQKRDTYNLGLGEQMTIADYARIVVETMKKHGYNGEAVIDTQSDADNNSGMDCSRFMNDCSWTPKTSVQNMVEEYLNELINEVKY